MALYTVIVYIPHKKEWRLVGHDEENEAFCRDYIWKVPGPPHAKIKTWNRMWNREGYFYEVIEL